ncbi:MAG: YHYH protein [Bacteroidetes bacterium]|nr:YHYH protein [Bacteroidota bacterium]
MKKTIITLFSGLSLAASAQIGPEVTSWIINTTNATGYGGISSNVQQVQYSTNNVYVSASCVPGYAIGPWAGNPNTPSNQNFVYKITRTPVQNMGTPTTVGLGHIGVWTNGVSIFNVSDGMSYNNAGVWNRNAYFWEGASFDNCLGHPAPNGEYHHHVSPSCLYNINASTVHSPIIGYAFDGYPVYGAYAYTNVNGTGAIKRMASSYQTTTTATRTNGPAVSSTYPVGCFMEDYSYVAGSGDLDARNGRFCVTPEYPSGTYAYFVTLDASLMPQFPYTFYKTYYGVVQTGNTGPTGGHNTITESVTTYTGNSNGLKEEEQNISCRIFPNPATQEFIHLFIDAIAQNNFTIVITDITGKIVRTEKNIQPTVSYTFDLNGLSKGVYFMKISNEYISKTEKIIIN